jgi:hypothetical protein
VVAPSRRLLDQPGDLGFVIGPEHPCFGATAICGCTCGIQECWFVVVSIEVTATTVRWSNFRNFHRGSWPYDLGPFVFERAAYERALAEPLRLAWDLITAAVGPTRRARASGSGSQVP